MGNFSHPKAPANYEKDIEGQCERYITIRLAERYEKEGKWSREKEEVREREERPEMLPCAGKCTHPYFNF